MTQRPLHQVQVPGLAVQPCRERVPQGVDRERAGDARLSEPPGKIELDLPGAEATAGLTKTPRQALSPSLAGKTGIRGGA